MQHERYVDWKRLNEILAPNPRRIRASVAKMGVGDNFRDVARIARDVRTSTATALRDLGQALSGRYNDRSAPALNVYAGGRVAATRLSMVRGNVFGEITKDIYPGAFYVSLAEVAQQFRQLEFAHPGRRDAYQAVWDTARQLSIPDVSRLIPVNRCTMPSASSARRQSGLFGERLKPSVWRHPDFTR